MAKFDLATFLMMFLGNLDVASIEQKTAEWLKTKGEEYPDAQDKIAALAAWLQQTIAEAKPGLDVATMLNTLKGIATDIVSGTAGWDKDSWQGAI